MKIKKEIKRLNKQLNVVEKDIEKNINEIEDWVIARKKFFIKLIWVVGLIAVLLIFSHLYLRISGVGV